jgi:hypothetical protein
MDSKQQSLEDIQNIRNMMERSSRFISLSGLSGISAGVCALIGAWLSYDYIYEGKEYVINPAVAIVQAIAQDYTIILNLWFFWIALGTFLAAFLSAFFFTWIKSRKQGIPIWGKSAKRLLFNVAVPLITGAVFLFRMLQSGLLELFAPGCLIFYGLALLNASKYTLIEIRYLGYLQILLGLINLWFVGYGLYFWAFGFGILHIVYGVYMWRKYDAADKS